MLDAWQERLEAHFKALADIRRIDGLPVFALEHGLGASERTVVASLLNRSLGTSRLGQHWLVWVVYAAEQGYDYDGDEYWTTFERRTPKWRDWADRRMLRRWFGQFHKRFAGFEPTGPWASWFSIIAWPITHALLPRDLQSQLARALYDHRYALARRLGGEPATIGRFLATMSHDASSRFRNFLEQEEIAGRIVLALLSGRANAVEKYIHPLTLERIVSDLQEVNTARAWLRDARQAVERVQLKGTARQIPSVSNGGTERSSNPPPQAFIRPALTLRRFRATEWTAVVELPSLRPLADLAPELNSFLRRSRCTVSGSQGTLPAGWLMQGDQRRVLTTWPRPEDPIIRFENPPAVLDQMLHADGRITGGPRWLFRIGPDGLAHEVIGRIVRPGQRYVLVSETPLASSVGSPVTVSANGVSSLTFELPRQLTIEMIAELRSLGLGVAQTVHLAPVGLAARRWDGEGFAEWTEGETPCLELYADHPVKSYAVQLDGGLSLTIPGNGLPSVYLKLTDLGVGSHTLTVVAQPSDAHVPGPAKGYISLTIRPPQPWITGTIGHSGLIVTAEPDSPSLDQFLQGALSIQAFGPTNQQITICVELLDSASGVLATELIATLPLPVTSNAWSRALTSFIKRETEPWAYLSAAGGQLLLDGAELGSWRIPLHREAAPVRWVWRHGEKGPEFRLVDDHEGEDPLAVQFFAFAAPATPTLIDISQIEAGFHPDGQGGLCLARSGGKHAALIVSMPRVETSLSDLVVEPKIRDVGDGHSALERLAALADLWSSAKFVGPLAADRRRAVLIGLHRELISRIFGAHWTAAEERYSRSPKTYQDLRQLVTQTGGPPAFNLVLARDLQKYHSLPLPKRVTEFDALARRYASIPPGASAAAFQLCEWLTAGGPFDHQLGKQLDLLRPVPALMRAARFVNIAAPALQAPPPQTTAAST